MPELENQHPLIVEMMSILTNNDFSESEAKTILKAIRCQNPEDMLETCDVVIQWACDTRRMASMLDVVLQTAGMGEDGRSLVTLSCEDGEVAFALDPSIDLTKTKIEGVGNG